jgi:hypothetical protein
MKSFRLNIHTENEAFDPDARIELVRLLRETAGYIERGGDIVHYQTIFDLNGNDVGRFALKAVEES